MVRLLIAGCVILATASAAVAQGRVNDAIAVAREAYQECVFFSVASQIRRDQKGDAQLFAERGFQSCLTEERYMRGLAIAAGATPTVVEQIVLAHRLAIKKQIQELEAKADKDRDRR